MKVIVSYSFIKFVTHLVKFMEKNMVDVILEYPSLEVDIEEIKRELEL